MATLVSELQGLKTYYEELGIDTEKINEYIKTLTSDPDEGVVDEYNKLVRQYNDTNVYESPNDALTIIQKLKNICTTDNKFSDDKVNAINKEYKQVELQVGAIRQVQKINNIINVNR